MASKPFMMRLDDETRARWESAAGSEALASFVKRTVDDSIAAASAPKQRRSVLPAAAGVPSSGRSTRTRTTPCEHRVPPGSFCKRCD